VFAVPRSIARSFENIESSDLTAILYGFLLVIAAG